MTIKLRLDISLPPKRADISVMPIALRGRAEGAELEYGEPGEPAYALRTGSGGSSKPMIAWAPDKAATLTAGVARKPGVNPPGRRQEDDFNIVCITGQTTHTLTSEGADASEDGTGRGTPIIAFDWQTSGSERTRPNISTVRTSTVGCTNRDAVMIDAGVRRLTPLECERLQGAPDGRTENAIDEKGRTVKQSDAQRYRQMGNSVAVPCVEWIVRRIIEVDALT